MGLEVVGLMNCKGFLNRYAVPEDMRRFQDNACGSSLGMITSFTDGTKMALEMNTVANATGFGPLRSGMVGFHNTSVRGCGDDLSQILPALLKGFSPPGFVDYTLGGDFGAGVFAVVKDKDPYESRFLDYFKMGKGPFRAVHRPYHLCQFEVSRSVAEIYLYDQVPCVPLGTFAKTSAVAKRDLMVGDRLEGIGGSDLYGILENTKDSKELVHISLCRGATVLKDYKKDEKIKRADLGLSRDMSELESLLL
jgi:predicted homoserine dehydrogenase-like protein